MPGQVVEEVLVVEVVLVVVVVVDEELLVVVEELLVVVVEVDEVLLVVEVVDDEVLLVVELVDEVLLVVEVVDVPPVADEVLPDVDDVVPPLPPAPPPPAGEWELVPPVLAVTVPGGSSVPVAHAAPRSTSPSAQLVTMDVVRIFLVGEDTRRRGRSSIPSYGQPLSITPSQSSSSPLPHTSVPGNDAWVQVGTPFWHCAKPKSQTPSLPVEQVKPTTFS